MTPASKPQQPMPKRTEAAVPTEPFQNHRFVRKMHVACFKSVNFQVVCCTAVDNRHSSISLNDHTATSVADSELLDLSVVAFLI